MPPKWFTNSAVTSPVQFCGTEIDIALPNSESLIRGAIIGEAEIVDFQELFSTSAQDLTILILGSTHPEACMNKELPSVTSAPFAVFDILEAIHNKPCPRLP